MTTYIKIEGDEVTVTFASKDGVFETIQMTRAELVEYINKAQ